MIDKVQSYRYLLTGWLVVWLVSTGMSQDIKKDLAAMNQYYGQAGDINIQVDVQVVDEQQKQLAARKALVSRKGKTFYYLTDETQMLLTEGAMIMVQEQEKEVLYQPHSKKTYEAVTQQTLTSNLDSVIQSYQAVRFEGVKQGVKHYTISTPGRYIEKTDLYLDAVSSSINRIIYHYNNQVAGNVYLVNMRFIHSAAPAISQTHFLESNYIITKGKKAQLAPQFHKYHLTVLRDEK